MTTVDRPFPQPAGAARRALTQRRRQGVSLIEAMVALTVMAFGMLSLVGVQATLRFNNDISKQRSEATWIATQELEQMRKFTALQVVNATPGISWAEIASRTVAAYTPPQSIGNASYRVVRTVSAPAANNQTAGLVQKVIKVEVTWNDRKGDSQRVVLSGIIGGVEPALSGLLSVPTKPSATNQVNARESTIPPEAVIQQDGQARFVPPGSADVAWYFNPQTGALSACNAAGSNCSAGRFISGRVRFHRFATVSAANAANPQGPAALNLADGPAAMALVVPVNVFDISSVCYADHYSAAELASAAVATAGVKYYCAVFSPQPKGWGGKLNPKLVDSTGALITPGNLSTDLKVCRYTPASGDLTPNVDHPLTYCVTDAAVVAQQPIRCEATRVITNLINQNFLVIQGDQTCPTDSAIDLAAGKLTSFNTLAHQP